MCGIAVAVDWEGAEAAVAKLIEGIRHRGDVTDPLVSPRPNTALCTRRLRIVAGALMLGFQLVLIASGNLSFLNWLTIVPILACFDDRALLAIVPRRARRRLEARLGLGEPSATPADVPIAVAFVASLVAIALWTCMPAQLAVRVVMVAAGGVFLAVPSRAKTWLGEQVVGDATRQAMKKTLADIQSGKFAKEWIEENKNGCPNFNKLREKEKQHPIEIVGAQLRGMMSWLPKEGKKKAESPKQVVNA